MTPPVTHDECRSKLCAMCYKKGSSMEPLKEGGVDIQRLREFFLENYDLDNQKVPKSLCARDRKLLSLVSQGKKSKDDLPDPVDISKLDFGGLSGRLLKDKTDCNCSPICKPARATITPGHAKNQASYPRGNPNNLPVVSVQKPMLLCNDCLSLYARGHSHHCNTANFRANLHEISMRDQRARENEAARVVQEKAAQASASDKTISLTSANSKELKIPNPKRKSASKALYPDEPIPAEEWQKVATARGLSGKQAEGVAADLRVLKGRDTFEASMRERNRNLNKRLAGMYTGKRVYIDSSDPDEEVDENGKVARILFYCPELPDLVDYICQARGFHVQTQKDITLGIDGGGSWLKFSMTIVKVQDLLASPSRKGRRTRSSYADGVAPNKLKDSGVKKLIPVAYIQNAKESYDNLQLIVEAVGLNRISYTPAFDMKCGLTFMGLGTAASSFPCMWCTLPKSKFGDKDVMFIGGEKRRLKDIQDLAADYLEANFLHTGDKKLSSQGFYSCENPPLFESDLEDSLFKYVVQLVPPMELHMLLGLGNNLFKYLEHTMETLGWEVTLKRWLTGLQVKQSKHHGGQFNGNMMIRVLKGVNHLRTLLGKDLYKSQKLQDVLQAMEALENVRDACFGQTLDDNFEAEIRILGRLWLKLGMSVTIKGHTLFAHVAQFLHFKNPQDGPAKGLGYWSEHVFETVHHDFEQFWEQGYKRQLSLGQDYYDQGLKCIGAYASKHI